MSRSIPSFDELPNSAFVREAQLVPSPKRPGVPVPLPFSGPTLWRLIKKDAFPQPVKLSARVTAWQVGEVRAWIKAQQARASDLVRKPRKAGNRCSSHVASTVDADSMPASTPRALSMTEVQRLLPQDASTASRVAESSRVADVLAHTNEAHKTDHEPPLLNTARRK